MRKRKPRYTKSCKAGISRDMWIELQEMKVRTGKSKSQIIREALEMYKESL